MCYQNKSLYIVHYIAYSVLKYIMVTNYNNSYSILTGLFTYLRVSLILLDILLLFVDLNYMN